MHHAQCEKHAEKILRLNTGSPPHPVYCPHAVRRRGDARRRIQRTIKSEAAWPNLNASSQPSTGCALSLHFCAGSPHGGHQAARDPSSSYISVHRRGRQERSNSRVPRAVHAEDLPGTVLAWAAHAQPAQIRFTSFCASCLACRDQGRTRHVCGLSSRGLVMEKQRNGPRGSSWRAPRSLLAAASPGRRGSSIFATVRLPGAGGVTCAGCGPPAVDQ